MTIQSAVVSTENVYEDLQNTAQEVNLSPDELDFEILNIFTEYKTESGEFTQVEDMSVFDDDEFFSNPNLEIRQKYEVRYYVKKQKKPLNLPQIVVGSNRSFTKVIAKVKAMPKLKYFDNFSIELKNEIYKKLLKYGFLIGIRDANLDKELKKISSSVRIYEALNDDYDFEIAKGVKPIQAVDDALILHYKNKNQDDDTEITASRNVINTVVKDELIIEYIKAKSGKAGRNLKGTLLEVQDPKTENATEIQIGENIEKQESEDSIKYIAKIGGYVNEENNVYSVKEEYNIDEATIKTTGSIQAGLDSDVTINIKEQGTFKDAVGANIKIETSVVNISGNIAQGARIRAKSVTIGGQTHAKSYINADKAEISVLLGHLECKEGKIKRFEGGNIIAQKVEIESVLGGKIIAEEVYIKNLFSNCTITAAKTVEIEELRGVGNKIIIDITKIPVYEEKFRELSHKKDELNKQIYLLFKDLQRQKSLIDGSKKHVKDIQDKIEELDKLGSETPVLFLNKLKDYQTLVYEYNESLKSYKNKQSQVSQINKDIQEIQNLIFDSTIINKSKWKDMNEIRFHLIEPRQDIIYNTRKNEFVKAMKLKKIETSDLKIIYEIDKSGIMHD